MLTDVTEQSNAQSWQNILDPEVRVWRLEKTVLNLEECKSAGWSTDSLFIGSMTYLFNMATGRIVCSTGGGNVYIRTGCGFRGEPPETEAIAALEHAIVLYLGMDAIDVTEIVRDLTHYGQTHMQEASQS